MNEEEITKADIEDTDVGETDAEKPARRRRSADPRDAEIARLRAELDAVKGNPSVLLEGGTFTGSIKDGPTVTFAALAGERPEDAFLRVCGIHSTPHRIELHEVDEKHPCGVHLPNGMIKAMGGAEMFQPIGAPIKSL